MQKIVRYLNPDDQIYYGIVEGEEVLQLTSNFTELINDELKFDGLKFKYKDVKILEPVVPSKSLTLAGHMLNMQKKLEVSLFLRNHFYF